MCIKKIIEFINNEFPNEAKNVSAAIDLLVETIAQVNKLITLNYEKYSVPKYKDKFDSYRNMSLDLFNLIDVLNTYIENLTPDFDISDVEEDNQDSIDRLLDSKDKSVEQQKLLKKYNIDYNDSRLNANQNIPHSLYDNFTHTRPCAFEINGERIEVLQWRELLVKTCEYLYNLKDGEEKFKSFISDPDMNGSMRKYFSYNKKEIAEAQQIGKSNIYVIGNISAVFTRNLIIRLLNKFQIPKKDYNIFIRRDLSSLHIKDDIVEKQEKEIKKNKNISVDSELKIGQYAQAVLTNIFKSKISEEELTSMQDKNWSHETLGICYPLLKKRIKGIPDEQQRTYGNVYNRYYKNPAIVNGEEYFLCSQWFEEFRSNLDNWLSLRKDKNIVITHYYKIKHGTYTIVLEEEILKILLKALHDDYSSNNFLNVSRIRTKYDDIIAQNTKYQTTPQTVLYTLIGRLTDMGIISLAPNCHKGKYVIKDENKLLQMIEDCKIISE